MGVGLGGGGVKRGIKKSGTDEIFIGPIPKPLSGLPLFNPSGNEILNLSMLTPKMEE